MKNFDNHPCWLRLLVAEITSGRTNIKKHYFTQLIKVQNSYPLFHASNLAGLTSESYCMGLHCLVNRRREIIGQFRPWTSESHTRLSISKVYILLPHSAEDSESLSVWPGNRGLASPIPDKFSVKGAPPLSFGWCSWTFKHTAPPDLIRQPVSTAIAHNKFIQEHQLALWSIKPVVVGICNSNCPLETWEEQQKQK